MKKDTTQKNRVPKNVNLFSTSLRILGTTIKMVCDPITQVCYPVLEEHWHEHYRKPWPVKYARRMLILDITLLTVIATLVVTAMIYTFVTPPSVLPALVNIDVVAPGELVSGMTTEYDVAYRNDSEKKLGCAIMRLRLPAGSVLEEKPTAPAVHETSCPAPGNGFAYDTVIESDGDDGPVLLVPIGTVQPHGHDLIRVRARTYGATGSRKVMLGELLYWEEARTTPLRVSARTEWNVARSIVALSATPSSGAIFRGQQYAVTFSVAAHQSVGPLLLQLHAPKGFVVTGTIPEQITTGEWTITGGTPKLLRVEGYFDATPGPKPPSLFTVDAFITLRNQKILVESLRWNADPKTNGFALTQEMVSPGRTALLPGETVRVAVHYRNNGTRTLKNMSVTLTADPRFVEAASPAKLQWDKTNAPELAKVAPGKEGMLTMQFRVVRDVTKKLLGMNERPQLYFTTTATYALADDLLNPITVSTRTDTFTIASRATVQAAGVYFTKDGEQLGIGPLPPKVDATTKYRVFLDVANSSGEANDVVLEAMLPPNVEWTGRYSVGAGQAIDWLPSTRTVRWVIGTLSPFTNSEGEHLGASFEVALTPRAQDVGTVPRLATDISLHGKDKTTGLALHAEAESVTTDLPFDKRAIGKGAVEK